MAVSVYHLGYSAAKRAPCDGISHSAAGAHAILVSDNLQSPIAAYTP
jgi:hypothetical protein